MRKNIFYISLMTIFFVSCDMKEDFKQENSKAVEFAGEWNYAVYSADMNTVYKIYDANKLLTYNTSADLANEIWIQSLAVPFKLNIKFKSNFSGDKSSFSSPQTNNIQFISLPAVGPDSVGAVTSLVQYKACAVQVGKILPNAGISKSGNPTDSIYMQIAAVENTSSFIGVTSGTSVVWQVQSNTDANVQLIIAGQRATGFVEDIW